MARALLCACVAAAATATTVTVTVSPAATFGEWQGWGVSLAWWANVWGAEPGLADAVFSLATVSVQNNSLLGLGLQRARYNAGASSNHTTTDGSSMVVSPNMPAWKQIGAFWVDWLPAPAGTWDWTADANQVAMLRAAAARGADAEIFSNSPVWWMCSNHNPSGSASGSDDNLQPWNHAQHAAYVATVAAHARDAWGVTFSTIELFNEPIANWWKASGTQEGCHFDAATQAAVLAELPGALAAANLTGVRVAASDESRIDMALSTWGALPAAARSVIDVVNVHGYQEGGDRAGLYRAVVQQGGKELRDSEYGDGDGTGGEMVASILADLAALHPRAWAYWQVVDVSAGWALLRGDAASGALGPVNAKWFALAQFSRHIRAGMAVLATADSAAAPAAAAALDAAAGLLVLVLSNAEVGAADFDVDLTAFAAVPAGAAAAWATSTAGAAPTPGAAHTALAGVAVGADRHVRLSLPPWTVVTIEVSGVRA